MKKGNFLTNTVESNKLPCRGGEKESRKIAGWGYRRLEIDEKYLRLTVLSDLGF